MSFDLRKPMITSPTEQGQLLQIKSYLVQLVEQLNFALRTLESGSGGTSSTEGEGSLKLTAGFFNELKSLIMKSSEISDAFYSQIEPKIEDKISTHNKDAAAHDEIKKKLENKLDNSDEVKAELVDLVIAALPTWNGGSY